MTKPVTWIVILSMLFVIEVVAGGFYFIGFEKGRQHCDPTVEAAH